MASASLTLTATPWPGWGPLLEELREKAESYVSPLAWKIYDEVTFRLACSSINSGETKTVFYTGHFIESLSAVTKSFPSSKSLEKPIAGDWIDPQLPSQMPEGWEKRHIPDPPVFLIWKLAFTIIQTCLEVNISVSEGLQWITMVNLKIPVHRFSIGLPYPEVPGVQKPLQEIFRWYINSLLSILEMIKEEGEIRARTDRNHTHITETLESIDIESRNLIIHSNNYIRALGLATQDERRYQAKRQRVLQVTVEQPAFIKGQETTISFDSSVRLGSGSFGVVYKVHERSTGAIFARKYIPLFKEGRINLEDRDIEHEVAVTQKLRHRHIVTIPFHFKNFEENAFDIFMSPAAECNLKELLEKADKPQPLFYPWFSFLLDALAHVHDQFIIHNDIKPGNILIRDDQPYISDFGISKDWTKAEGNFVPFRQRYGTRGYRAPELPEGDSEPQTSRSVAPTELTDIFALGCTFSEMLTIAVGKSINEYEEIRNNRNFRDCLVEVSRWIHALKDENNHLAHIMVGEISKMIAAQAKERGRAWDYVQSLANYTGAYR